MASKHKLFICRASSSLASLTREISWRTLATIASAMSSNRCRSFTSTMMSVRLRRSSSGQVRLLERIMSNFSLRSSSCSRITPPSSALLLRIEDFRFSSTGSALPAPSAAASSPSCASFSSRLGRSARRPGEEEGTKSNGFELLLLRGCAMMALSCPPEKNHPRMAPFPSSRHETPAFLSPRSLPAPRPDGSLHNRRRCLLLCSPPSSDARVLR
mmetsp:Transcript_49803/g.155865  ORF Transcript_49803/g.155865 Transcript_49803/m.155865 type:complete len:214 (+) Transcript_49803:1919-2560(+)